MGKGLGIFGGTFDPVHTGHVALALQVCQQLDLTQCQLMPTHLPPHRANPSASAAQRADMVRLAIAEHPMLALDERELVRTSTSYTIDSLRAIRREQGETVALFFVMGMDSLNALDTWRDWQQLADYAHIVVLARPGQEWPAAETVVGTWLTGRIASPQDLSGRTHGAVIRLEADLLQSATAVRAAVARGEQHHPWLVPSVATYIAEHKLYG